MTTQVKELESRHQADLQKGKDKISWLKAEMEELKKAHQVELNQVVAAAKDEMDQEKELTQKNVARRRREKDRASQWQGQGLGI